MGQGHFKIQTFPDKKTPKVLDSRLFQTFPEMNEKEYIFPDFSGTMNPALVVFQTLLNVETK